MKKMYPLQICLLMLAVFLSTGSDSWAQVGINSSGSVPDGSAILDVSSTTKGQLMPRMTTTERNAIATPAQSLMIFNTTTNCLEIFMGTWISITCANNSHPCNSVGGTASATVTSGACGYSTTLSLSGYNGSVQWQSSTDNTIFSNISGGTTNPLVVTVGNPTMYYKAVVTDGLSCTGASSSTVSATATACCTNAWTAKLDFAGTARRYGAGFAIGTKGYIGTGYDDATNFGDFWEYDQVNNTWTQKANFGGTGRQEPVAFAVGGKGYIGTGWNGSSRVNDFWEYNPGNDSWSQKANVGGPGRAGAVGFSIGSKGYMGLGDIGVPGSLGTDMWEYDPSNNSWSSRTTFPGGGCYFPTGFGIGTKGYVVTGQSTSGYALDFWEFDQAGNSWTQKTNFPAVGRYIACSFAIGTKGYVIGGAGDSGAMQDVWQWDQSTGNWTSKTNIPHVTFGAVAFVIDNKGYVGTGQDASGKLKLLWEYCP